MRYLGCKDLLVDDIVSLIRERCKMSKNTVFFDAFCGTGAVAVAMSSHCQVAINDILKCCTTYTKGRLCNPNRIEKKLGVNPFEVLNNPKGKQKGFFATTYSPYSGRMYFSKENAERIDFCRQEIEKWKEKLSESEYSYLLACLLDSVSDVSNTAGVYGAFLKTWDRRALKPFVFRKLDCLTNGKASVVGCNNYHTEDNIREVECDILYLDPPYTQNQYGTQYHLLETLVENDCPSVSKITGSRPVTPYRSKWSRDIDVHVAFEKTIAETKAKYIILSYSNDGFMTPEFIKDVMCRYGKEESFLQKEVGYKKYTNKKSKRDDEHKEYLFFVEKKNFKDVVVDAPLNYTGSKAGLVHKLRRYIPKKKEISLFVDLFGGGFNFGVNMPYQNAIYNDINDKVVELMRMFYENDCSTLVKKIKATIKKYGIEKGNRESYLKLRNLYNAKSSPLILYVLILYGFQQQIRFNGKKQFNNPPGNRWFNECLLSRCISFCRTMKMSQVEFVNSSYEEVLKSLGAGTFIYADPPYSGTLGVYNDGKRGYYGWTTNSDVKLLESLDAASQRGAKFMLSYVDDGNLIIVDWAKKNKYNLIHLDSNQGKYNRRKELIVVNYESEAAG